MSQIIHSVVTHVLISSFSRQLAYIWRLVRNFQAWWYFMHLHWQQSIFLIVMVRDKTKYFFYFNIGDEGHPLGGLFLSMKSPGEIYPAFLELCHTNATSLWTSVRSLLDILNLWWRKVKILVVSTIPILQTIRSSWNERVLGYWVLLISWSSFVRNVSPRCCMWLIIFYFVQAPCLGWIIFRLLII